ncbi:hypothetical protein ADUPG1_009629, partial [Aduncisulcus paluster]
CKLVWVEPEYEIIQSANSIEGSKQRKQLIPPEAIVFPVSLRHMKLQEKKKMKSQDHTFDDHKTETNPSISSIPSSPYLSSADLSSPSFLLSHPHLLPSPCPIPLLPLFSRLTLSITPPPLLSLFIPKKFLYHLSQCWRVCASLHMTRAVWKRVRERCMWGGRRDTLDVNGKESKDARGMSMAIGSIKGRMTGMGVWAGKDGEHRWGAENVRIRERRMPEKDALRRKHESIDANITAARNLNNSLWFFLWLCNDILTKISFHLSQNISDICRKYITMLTRDVSFEKARSEFERMILSIRKVCFLGDISIAENFGSLLNTMLVFFKLFNKAQDEYLFKDLVYGVPDYSLKSRKTVRNQLITFSSKTSRIFNDFKRHRDIFTQLCHVHRMKVFE